MSQSEQRIFPQSAKWIWPTDQATPNTHVLFRQDIEVQRDTEIEICIAAETYAQVYWDDQLVHRYNGVSYPNQHYFDRFRLEGVKPGLHKLAILVEFIGIPSGSTSVKDPGLLCEIYNIHEDKLMSTSTDWSALVLDAWRGQRRRAAYLNLDFVEDLDLRALPAAFPGVALKDCHEDLYAGAYPGCRMPIVEERSFPFLQTKPYRDLDLQWAGVVDDAGHEDPAWSITEEGRSTSPLQIDSYINAQLEAPALGKATSLFFELGNYITGYPELHIIASAGTVVDIAYHEFATDHQFDFKQSKLRAADRFTLCEGLNIVKPSEWKALRYLQITIRDQSQPCIIKDLLIEQSEYPLQPSIQIECEHKALQKIVDISLNAVALCMHGIMVDCPWREKRQWIGDVQRIALINHHSFQDAALVRAVLKQHKQLQSAEGQMWACQPLDEEYPSQSMEWFRAVLEYVDYTGDQSLIDDVAVTIDRLAEWFASWINQDGLLHITHQRTMAWMDNTFSPIRNFKDKTPYACMNLRYVQFLQDMAKMKNLQGDEAWAAVYTEQADALKQTIVDHFYLAEEQLFKETLLEDAPDLRADCTQALAVCLDLPGVDGAAVWEAFTRRQMSSPETCIFASPFGKYHVHQALGKLGKSEEILDDIMQHWGPMVQQSSATTWEFFAGNDHQSLAAHSQCHGWAGIPVIALVRHIMDLDPRELQFDQTLETKLGKIRVHKG